MAWSQGIRGIRPVGKLVLAGWLAVALGSTASAQMGGRAVDSFGANYGRGVQPLFNNYFTGGASDQANAGMYISPVEVPGNVGHTYNTYQPFWPHEYTYLHKDRYHSYYDNGRGLNRTSAHYSAPPARTAARWVYKKIEIPR